jgi:erythromycin esterase-like protein
MIGPLASHVPVGMLAQQSAGIVRPSLERAIGVIDRPQTERQSHYFQAHIAEQFDAVIHLDETRALEPQEYTSTWDVGEVPETFPLVV